MTPKPYVTNEEVRKLNDARDVLETLAKRFYGTTVHGTADSAQWLLFKVLNHAVSYQGVLLTDEQLHARKGKP